MDPGSSKIGHYTLQNDIVKKTAREEHSDEGRTPLATVIPLV